MIFLTPEGVTLNFRKFHPRRAFSKRMKTILLIFLLTLPVFAQRKEASVCANQSVNTKPVVLNICNYTKGMSWLPRLRLYLRVYADGSAEYEENTPWKEGGANNTLVKHKFKINAERLEEIVKLGQRPDFQSAKADYPIFQIWTDSGLETTITFSGKDGDKKILVRNYSSHDKKNDEHYPASLLALLRLAEELRKPKPNTSKPQTLIYAGTLAVGKTYLGRVNFGSAYGMTLTPFPMLPHHHSVMYAWPNVKDFPELDPDKGFGVRWIVFRVLSKKIEHIEKNRWADIFTIEIVRVE